MKESLKILLLGGGGREHALAWKIAASPLVAGLHVSPGNPGMESFAECASLDINDPVAVADRAADLGIDLVVVGPEAPLVAGVADEAGRRGIPVFGPSRAAARLEGSKVFSKEFMSRNGVPTAAFSVFEEAPEALRFVRGGGIPVPAVVKADGLAAGKGVIMCPRPEAAEAAIERIMVRREFGSAGDRVVIEECLKGREASFFVLTDGIRSVPLATCQDYKRLLDGDAGPNTGGMGGFSPSPFIGEALADRIMREIVEPTISGLAAEGSIYRGVLYVGLMLEETGPRVLEYNARFGDPETQALMPRLDSDIVPYLMACATGRLDLPPPRWRSESSVCVVMASEGYPGSPQTGRVIDGLDAASGAAGVEVFHAGTGRGKEGRVVTTGGRVLAVTALGADLGAARERAYGAVRGVRFDGMKYRTDIAANLPEATD